MYHVVLELKPPVSLEIGVEDGLGSAHMCYAAKQFGGHVIGIDINQSKFASEELPKQFDNYHFIHGNSLSKWSIVMDIIYKFGELKLVYQDSSHHYMPSHEEFALYSSMMPNGGNSVWICDDITPAFHDPKVDPEGKGMIQYFDELPGIKMKFKNILHFGSVQGIVIL